MSSYWWAAFTVTFLFAISDAVGSTRACESHWKRRHLIAIVRPTVPVYLSVSIDVNSETTAYPEIPKHLLECYMKDGIYHRANRFPSSYESFLDLIRKVENSPTSRNMNARELSLVLLHYLKLDGIQSIQSQTKTSSNILPFAPSGEEYFKHRVTLVGLIGRIDQSYLSSINETLTKKELCNLHFMLSYSIDPYKRDNERCSPLYEEIKGGRTYAESKSDWNPYQTIPNYYSIRNKRNPGEKKIRTRKSIFDSSIGDLRERYIESLREFDETELAEVARTQYKRKYFKKNLALINYILRPKRSAEDKKLEVETFPVRNFQEEHRVREKDKFTIGNHELLGTSEDHPKRLQSLVQMHTGRYGGRPYSRAGHSVDGSVYSGLLPGMTLSDCPSVNGIITTPYGSLSIGTVIAGIAAGLNPEDIPLPKLSVSPEEMENPSDRINNIWATTLAGTIADTISSSAVLDDNFQILQGGWNESSNPQWYLLKNSQFKHMTEVALRGSLDGLFLGVSTRELIGKYPNLKLSEMLQIYYEFLWGNVGAKNRVQMRPQYAPDETFRKQVHLMSLVLKKQKTNVITLLDLNLVTRDAVSRVSSSIQNLERHSIENSESDQVDIMINLVAVIDSAWGYSNLNKIFEIMRSAGVSATPLQSNLTVMCGYDGKILMYAVNSIDLNSYFTREMLLQNCSRGMNYPVVFDSLEYFYRKLYMEEESSKKVNVDAQVVLLFPYDTFISENDELTVLKSKEFQQKFPDVRLMIAANGRSEAFNTLVKNQKDIFAISPASVDPNMKTVKDLTEGIKKSFQRFSKPSCGSYFDDKFPNMDVRVTKDVYPDRIVYYRLLPQYFFTVRGVATVSIRSKHRAPLTVCHSREVERPTDLKTVREDVPRYPNAEYNPYLHYSPHYSYGKQTVEDKGPVQCKTITSEEYKIELTDPCYGAYTLDECAPLYFSLQANLPSLTLLCPTCRLPINIQYEISAVGLTCYNSANSILVSSVTLIFSIFIFLFNVRLV